MTVLRTRRGPRRRRRAGARDTWFLAALCCAGCGGTHESSVSGTVYLDEQPLRTGDVTFYPTAGGAPAYSQLEGDGSYRLRTGSETGLKSGEYKVTVIATENPPAASGQTPAIGKRITPEKYSRLEETDLVHIVQPGENQIDLRLTSQ